jgi:hypothetical protein
VAPRPRRYAARLGVLALCLLCLAALPQFVRMPLGNDTVHYDLCARALLRGGAPYRDVFDTNLPGIVWLHVAVRSLLGWSSEAMRLADFAVVASVVCLLSLWQAGASRRRVPPAWVAVLLLAFYFSTSEFCHAQRDVWMLLPALAAAHLRRRQWELAGAGGAPAGAALRAAAEGLCWGLAIWIKPFVLLPVLLCWAVTAARTYRPFRPRAKWALCDLAGLLGGGLLAGCLGCGWLWHSGAWRAFWDVLLSWNGGYYSWAQGEGFALRTAALFLRFFPWSAVHLVALPLAVAALWRGARPPRAGQVSSGGPGARALLAALYLGWVVQATYFQHGFVYQHVPGVLLGLALVAGWDFPWGRAKVSLALLGVFACLAALSHPVLRPGRLCLWARCWQEKSGPDLRDRLALTSGADWQDLQRVADYLRAQEVRDGEVTCFGYLTVHLYDQLGVAPSTRFTLFNLFLYFFPNHAQEMRDELAASPQRFLVADVRDPLTSRLTEEQARAERPGGLLALPPEFPPTLAREYPWSGPVVFRAGRYYVFCAAGHVPPLSPPRPPD